MREKLKAARSKTENALQQEASGSRPRSLKKLGARKAQIRLDNEIGEGESSVMQENESKVSARVKFHDSVRKVKQRLQVRKIGLFPLSPCHPSFSTCLCYLLLFHFPIVN
nr:coiled-coil and C2 domain-containing protein 2A-like [Anolis sagrei ordinatus]